MRSLLALLVASTALAAEPMVRLGSTRFRIPGPAHDLAISPNGKYVVVDGSMFFYCFDAETGAIISTINSQETINSRTLTVGDDGEFTSIENNDGQMVLSRYRIREPRYFRKHRLPAVNGNQSLVISPDGGVLSTTQSNNVVLISTVTGKTLGQLPRPSSKNLGTLEVIFSGDGRRIALVESNGDRIALTVHDRDTAALRFQWEVKKHFEYQTALFSPDAANLVVVANDRITIFSCEDGRQISTFKPDGGDQVIAARPGQQLAVIRDEVLVVVDYQGAKVRECRMPIDNDEIRVSANGRWLVLCSVAGAVSIIDLERGIILPQSAEFENNFYELRFTPAGRLICRTDRYLAWDGQNLKYLGPVTTLFSGRFGAQFDLSHRLSTDAEHLAVFDSATGKHRVIATATGKTVWTAKKPLKIGGDENRTPCLFFIGTELHCDVGSDTKIVPLSAAGPGKAVRLQGMKEKTVADRIASPDGSAVISLLSGERPVTTFVVHDTRTGRKLMTGEMSGGFNLLMNIAFSPDCKHFSIISQVENPDLFYNQAILYSLITGRQTERINLTFVGTSLTMSHDNRLLAVDLNGTVQIVERCSGKVRVTIPVQEEGSEISSLAFVPGDRAIAVSTCWGTVEFWSIAGPELPKTLKLESLWSDLANPDAEIAYRAMEGFRAQPVASVPFLSSQLPPAAPVDHRYVEARIVRLDAAIYGERETATRELAVVAERIIPQLRRALAACDSEERRERLARLLALAENPTNETRRVIRAVEVIESIGDAQARKLLETWSRGQPDSRLTLEALTALLRKKPDFQMEQFLARRSLTPRK